MVLLFFFSIRTRFSYVAFFEKAERLLGKLFEASVFNERYLKICQEIIMTFHLYFFKKIVSAWYVALYILHVCIAGLITGLCYT